jgi:seryl-tRNA synthetase
MNTRWLPAIMIILLVSLVITGCGVSQSQYSAMAADLNQAKQDHRATQTQLQAAQSESMKANVDLAMTQGQLKAIQEQLQAAQTDLKATQAQLQTAQSELTKTKTDLNTAQGQVQSLQKDQTVANKKQAEALSYAVFLDMVQIEIWMANGLTPRFPFTSAEELIAALKTKAAGTGDAYLIAYAAGLRTKMGQDEWMTALYGLWYYSLGKMENDLK